MKFKKISNLLQIFFALILANLEENAERENRDQKLQD